MKKIPTILAIDDEPDMLETYKLLLRKKYSVICSTSAEEGIGLLKTQNIQCILLDIRMPKIDGITALKMIREFDGDTPIVIVTASKDLKTAVDAIKGGAIDFVIKPFANEELLKLIEKSINNLKLLRENSYLKQALEEKTSGNLLGSSIAMQNILNLIYSASSSDSTVLITGESGTGKELIANALHKNSKRKNKSFVAINCAAIPDNLFESELFGHEKGSFTGALDRKLGKFEIAHEGTIFLDEIGCMPLNLQAKLLRVIQGSCIERIGGIKPIPIDVRIIAATNVDLAKSIELKSFREDLFYRVNVIPIAIPALRNRREDIPIYLNYFLTKYNRELNKTIAGFTPGALDILNNYDWPGNVRELQNIIERLVVLSKNKYIQRDELNLSLEKPKRKGGSLKEACDQFERDFIANALKECRGNQSKAAKLMGIHRTTLISKMQNLGIIPKSQKWMA